MAAEVQRRDGVELRLRIGLNSGQVIAGEIGSGAFGYTAIGEQVGMAQRMESVAPPGGVMVSESTARLVDHVAVLSETQMVSIKGADAPVPAHRLVAMEPHRSSHGRSEVTLVGRQQQITALTELLDRSMSGHGGVVGVVGAAGIGKSRVVREVTAIAAERGVDVFWTFCESLASEIPLHVVSGLLRAAARITELDGAAARDRYALGFAAPTRRIYYCSTICSVSPNPTVAPTYIDPDARRQATDCISQ